MLSSIPGDGVGSAAACVFGSVRHGAPQNLEPIIEPIAFRRDSSHFGDFTTTPAVGHGVVLQMPRTRNATAPHI